MGNLVMVNPAEVASNNSYAMAQSNTSVIYRYDSETNRLDDIITDSTTYSFAYDAFGNTTEISAGNHELASYEYNAQNGKLSVLNYGNGKKVKYVYDVLDRISEIQYNSGNGGAYETAYKYTYDTAGNLFLVEDIISGENTVFEYDDSGRLLSSYVYDAETFRNLYGISVKYDEQQRAYIVDTTLDYSIGNNSYEAETSYRYTYSAQTGNVSQYTIYGSGVTGSIAPIYDGLGRTTNRTISLDSISSIGFYNRVQYDYHTGGNQNYETGRVSSFISETGTSESDTIVSQRWYYVYDNNGNITEIRDSGANGQIYYRYEYDNLGQLIREDNRALGYSYTYRYDAAGNILTKARYAFTTGTLGSPNLTYGYTYGDNSWGDLLTSFAGNYIEYDEIGNPTRIGNYDEGMDLWMYGYDLEWDGRELVSYSAFEFGSSGYVSTVEYTYNADGIRTSKTVNGVEHLYYLNGSQILAETWTSGSVEYMLMYVYDETGSPIAIKYRTSNYAQNTFDVFFFEKNLHGDIVAIYNESGTKIGTYTYDAWGSIKATTNSSVSLEKLIVTTYNPFRYRGYYYDADTQLYYLQSRYYNPQWGRFLNQDKYVSTGQGLLGYNMFAYCNNNPIMYIDSGGDLAWWIIAIIVVAVVVVVAAPVAKNVYEVVDSNNFVEDKKDTEPMESEKYKEISKNNTRELTREEKLSYIKAYKNEIIYDEDGNEKGHKAEDWSEAQMLREFEYHEKGYEIVVFFGSDPEKEGSWANRFRHVDFEENQTFGTYAKRFIGNLIP